MSGPAAILVAARSCRDGHCAVLPRWSLRGPAAMAHCAVLPRWSLRGPAAMVVARSCRDGRCAVRPRWSLRGPAAMARCAVRPRWLTARSCRDGRCAVLPRRVFQTWKRPRRRYAVFRQPGATACTSRKVMRARLVRCQAFSLVQRCGPQHVKGSARVLFRTQADT